MSVAAPPGSQGLSGDIPELTVMLGAVVASVALKRLGSAAADSIPACRPREVDLPALCRRRLPETAERDLIGAWQLPQVRSVRSPVAPSVGGGDLNDRCWCGRTQAVVDGGRGRRGWPAVC